MKSLLSGLNNTYTISMFTASARLNSGSVKSKNQNHTQKKMHMHLQILNACRHTHRHCTQRHKVYTHGHTLYIL